MAFVDFSNAVLTPIERNPMQYGNLCLDHSTFYNSGEQGANAITTNHTMQIVVDVPTQKSFVHTGTFTASGTELYLYGGSNYNAIKVSNISFQAGDTFSVRFDAIVSVS